MGRGNVCVTGKHEGLYYIDNEDFVVYRKDDPDADEPETCLLRNIRIPYNELNAWHEDETDTMSERDDVLDCFAEAFCNLFPSFYKPTDEM